MGIHYTKGKIKDLQLKVENERLAKEKIVADKIKVILDKIKSTNNYGRFIFNFGK